MANKAKQTAWDPFQLTADPNVTLVDLDANGVPIGKDAKYYEYEGNGVDFKRSAPIDPAFDFDTDGWTFKSTKKSEKDKIFDDYDIVDGKFVRVKNFPTTPAQNRGDLDKVAKALPIGGGLSAQDELEALARGNFSLKNGIFGGSSKTGKIVDGTKVVTPTNLGGTGNAGGFNTPGGTSKASTDLVKLANPVFTAGGSEKGATVDIYKGTINSPQNAIQSILNDVLGVASRGLGGLLKTSLASATASMNIISNITSEDAAKNVLDKFKSSILSGVPLTNESVKKILYESIGYDGKSLNFKDGIRGVGKGILKDIVDNVDGVKGIMTLYNGVEILTKSDINTTQAIFQIIDNFSKDAGNGILLDVATKLNIMKTVTQSVMNLGIPDVFKKMYDKLNDKDKDRYVRDNLSGGLEAGDLSFLELALDHRGSAWVLSVYPNAVNILVSSYTPATPPDGHIDRSEYDKFITLLNRLDPDWYKAKSRNGQIVGNLNVFSNFNKQAKLAFLAGGDRAMIRNIMLGEKYGTIYNTLDELQKRHPYYPIK